MAQRKRPEGTTDFFVTSLAAPKPARRYRFALPDGEIPPDHMSRLDEARAQALRGDLATAAEVAAAFAREPAR